MSTAPALSTAAQEVSVGQVTELNARPESIPRKAFQELPSHTYPSPWLLTAAQKLAEEHDTATGAQDPPLESNPPLCCVHDDPFQVAYPPFSRARQKVAVGHDTPTRGYAGDVAVDHVVPLQVKTDAPTAAQNDEVGQETETTSELSICVGPDHDVPFQVNALPSEGIPLFPSPTASQNVVVGQETDLSRPPLAST
ncbi:MAG: hypothetical protein ACLPYY_05245 [Acidimicrobiales bacterium]